MVVVHARVWTGNPAQPWAEALAVNGDAILAVGDAASIRKLIGSRTRVLDARGGMVTPGFIDSHVHFLAGGMSLTTVQLARRPQQRGVHCAHQGLCRNRAAGNLDHRAAIGTTRIGAGNCRARSGSTR